MKNFKFIYKFNFIFILLSIILIFVGCAENKNIGISGANNYLHNKYGIEFAFISDNHLSRSIGYNYTYSDLNNNQFIVQDTDNYYLDNYYSFKYDKILSSYIQKDFSSDLKVYINTKANFTSYPICNTWKDYLQKCESINIIIYTYDNLDEEFGDRLLNKIKTFMEHNSSNALINLVINQVNTIDFNNINYDNHNDYTDIIFSISINE